MRRIVVAGGKRFERAKATDDGGRDRCLRTPGDDDVGVAQTNVVQGADQGCVGRSAGRDGVKIDAVYAKAHGDNARRGVGKNPWNVEGAKAGRAAGADILAHLFFDGFKAAHGRRPDHACARAVLSLPVQARIANGFIGDHQRVLTERIQTASFAPVQIVGCVEALEFARNPALELAGVKAGDRRGAVDAGQQILPIGVDVAADGRQRTHSGHYRSFWFHESPLSGQVRPHVPLSRYPPDLTRCVRPEPSSHSHERRR